jgi:hypothetical protein
MNHVETALQYASRGWYVFPCLNKEPYRTIHGFEEATTDPKVICSKRWPEIGLRLGECSGLSALDIDVRERHNGFDVLASLGVDPSSGLVAATPSGGLHLFYKYIPSGKFDIAPGLEWRSERSYVVVPPGSGRRWLAEGEASEAPEWLRVLVRLRGNIRKRTHVSPAMGGGEEGASSFLMSEQFGPTRNFGVRTNGILRWLEAAKRGERNDRLFKAGCMFAKIIGEGMIKPSIAEELLMSSCWVNGLWQEDGEEVCRRTIGSAFRTVEEKLLGKKEIA